MIFSPSGVIQPTSGEGAERFELLVRMRARDGTLIPPGAFIPAAEQFRLMTDIDRWRCHTDLTQPC